jgi:hypothetical protein
MDDCQAKSQPSAIIFRIPMPIFLESFSNSRIQKWRRITLFFLLTFVSIFGWMRMAEAIKVYTYLIQLGLNPHPLYFVISGGLIGILFIIALITLISKSTWSTRLIRFCSVFIGILFLIENAVFSINKVEILSMVMGLIFIILIYLLPEKSSESLKIK